MFAQRYERGTNVGLEGFMSSYATIHNPDNRSLEAQSANSLASHVCVVQYHQSVASAWRSLLEAPECELVRNQWPAQLPPDAHSALCNINQAIY